jgi:hypothetical protein
MKGLDRALFSLGVDVTTELARNLADRFTSSTPEGVSAPVDPGPPGAASAPAAAARPLDDTLNFRLSDAVRKPMAPALASIGFEFRDAVRLSFSKREHLVTQIQNHTISKVLMQVDAALLERPSRETIDSVGMLGHVFKDPVVYVFAEKVDAPAFAVKNIFENIWASMFKVTGRFVPWKYVRDLEGMSLREQVEFVRANFELPDALPATAGVSTEDLLTLVDIITEFTDFGHVAGRQALLLLAGLRDATSTVDLQGAPNTVALNLVFHVLRLPKPAFANLLGAIKKQDALPPGKTPFLDALIDKQNA